MAKSVQMARAAYRVRGRRWQEDQVFATPSSYFVSSRAVAILRREIGMSGVGPLAVSGMAVFVNDDMCAARWIYTGHPLRKWATRYLRRHGVRR